MKTELFAFLMPLMLCFNSADCQTDTLKADFTSEKSHPWYVPSYVGLQYAGNTGFLSACAGFNLYKEKLFCDLGYGYTPSDKAGTDIHNIILRLDYRPWRWDFNILHKDFSFNPFTVSLAVTKQIHSDYTWGKLPNYYPKGYYHQNEVRTHLNLGVNLSFKIKKTKIDTYWQVTTSDVYLSYYNYYYHDNWIRWHKIFSQLTGMRIYIM